jgi:hypothetical protein
MPHDPASLPFDSPSSRSRYFKKLGILALGAALLPLAFSWMSHLARQTLVDQRTAERGLDVPRMRFLEASPQFRPAFNLALQRNFINERSSLYSSPALSYLDKKSLSSVKLVEQYQTLWRMLEHLQLKRDLALEERALHLFLAASSAEVLEAMGDKPDMYVGIEGYDSYKFLSEQGLAWYLQHYYLDPATALTQAHQYGTARQLIYDALHRLQFRTVPLSRYLRIPEYDRVMLLAAIYAMPEVLVGRDDSVQLMFKAVLDDFPEAVRFEIESHPFSDDLLPLKRHLLGIYDLRRGDYEAALSNFNENMRSLQRNYLRDLSTFMVVRTRFWVMHDKLVKQKAVLSQAEAARFAKILEDESRLVQAQNLRANIREYLSLVKTDFTKKEGLVKKPAPKEAPRTKQGADLPPLPSPRIVVPRLVPSIIPSTPPALGRNAA